MNEIVLELATAPATEPWTTAEAKAHLNQTSSADDTYIGTLITGARMALESAIGCAMFTQTRKRYLDSWPGRIILPRPPLQSVSGITYLDVDGAQQTLDSSVYSVYGARTTPDADAPLARVELAYGQSWPSIRATPQGIVVTYVCGWKTAAAIPQPIRHAVLLLIGEMYENRETSVVGSTVVQMPWFKRLVGEYRARYAWDLSEECW